MVSYYWEENADYENIHACLGHGMPEDEHFVEFARLHTSIFQQPPDDLTEDSYGVLIGGMAMHDMLSTARSFRNVLGELWELTPAHYAPYELAYPVFYNCRHVLELYLKILLGNDYKKHHHLKELAKDVEEKFSATLPSWVSDRILDFDAIDREGDLFRFADREPEDGELWTDFAQLQTVMDKICQAFETEIQRQRIRVPPLSLA